MSGECTRLTLLYHQLSLSLSLSKYIYINYCIGSLIEIFFVGLKFGRTVHYILKEKS